jgi:Flavin-binding monooxygenase-like/NAD(P)-binding Rossmann-like domain
MGSLPRHSISRIAVIGAGPSGIAAAKYLLAEKAFEKIDVFEQRHEVGGVWNLTTNNLSKKTPIPQLDPNYDVDRQTLSKPIYGKDRDVVEGSRLNRFETPLYDLLETNIPKQLMQYANIPFGDELPLFPRHESVLDYCKEYAEEVRGLIQFGCGVSEVRPSTEGPENENHEHSWSVTTIDEADKTPTAHKYNAVVVASGHFSVPYIPAIRGIKAWTSAYPGSVIHSKAYRNPATFTSRKVIVVGNSASGVDIGAQIGKVCKHPLLQSSRAENLFFSPEGVSWKHEVPEIVEFLDPKGGNRGVQFANGRIEYDIDAVVFATGYFYSFPFLKIDPPVIIDGLRTRDVYQQLFHIKHPTLAFPVLPQRIIPFPMAENQAAVVARIWSGRLNLPSEAEMRAWERRLLEDRGEGKAMHILNFPEDADYLNMLYDWAATAVPRPGLENDGMGKMGTRWDDKRRWMRSQFPAIKKAYAERGENRFSVRTAEELGFDYEKWKESQEELEEEYPMPARANFAETEGGLLTE